MGTLNQIDFNNEYSTIREKSYIQDNILDSTFDNLSNINNDIRNIKLELYSNINNLSNDISDFFNDFNDKLAELLEDRYSSLLDDLLYQMKSIYNAYSKKAFKKMETIPLDTRYSFTYYELNERNINRDITKIRYDKFADSDSNFKKFGDTLNDITLTSNTKYDTAKAMYEEYSRYLHMSSYIDNYRNFTIGSREDTSGSDYIKYAKRFFINQTDVNIPVTSIKQKIIDFKNYIIILEKDRDSLKSWYHYNKKIINNYMKNKAYQFGNKASDIIDICNLYTKLKLEELNDIYGINVLYETSKAKSMVMSLQSLLSPILNDTGIYEEEYNADYDIFYIQELSDQINFSKHILSIISENTEVLNEGIWQTIKDFFAKIWAAIKNLFSKFKKKHSSTSDDSAFAKKVKADRDFLVNNKAKLIGQPKNNFKDIYKFKITDLKDDKMSDLILSKEAKDYIETDISNNALLNKIGFDYSKAKDNKDENGKSIKISESVKKQTIDYYKGDHFDNLSKDDEYLKLETLYDYCINMDSFIDKLYKDLNEAESKIENNIGKDQADEMKKSVEDKQEKEEEKNTDEKNNSEVNSSYIYDDLKYYFNEISEDKSGEDKPTQPSNPNAPAAPKEADKEQEKQEIKVFNEVLYICFGYSAGRLTVAEKAYDDYMFILRSVVGEPEKKPENQEENAEYTDYDDYISISENQILSEELLLEKNIFKTIFDWIINLFKKLFGLFKKKNKGSDDGNSNGDDEFKKFIEQIKKQTDVFKNMVKEGTFDNFYMYKLDELGKKDSDTFSTLVDKVKAMSDDEVSNLTDENIAKLINDNVADSTLGKIVNNSAENVANIKNVTIQYLRGEPTTIQTKDSNFDINKMYDFLINTYAGYYDSINDEETSIQNKVKELEAKFNKSTESSTATSDSFDYGLLNTIFSYVNEIEIDNGDSQQQQDTQPQQTDQNNNQQTDTKQQDTQPQQTDQNNNQQNDSQQQSDKPKQEGKGLLRLFKTFASYLAGKFTVLSSVKKDYTTYLVWHAKCYNVLLQLNGIKTEDNIPDDKLQEEIDKKCTDVSSARSFIINQIIDYSSGTSDPTNPKRYVNLIEKKFSDLYSAEGKKISDEFNDKSKVDGNNIEKLVKNDIQNHFSKENVAYGIEIATELYNKLQKELLSSKSTNKTDDNKEDTKADDKTKNDDDVKKKNAKDLKDKNSNKKEILNQRNIITKKIEKITFVNKNKTIREIQHLVTVNAKTEGFFDSGTKVNELMGGNLNNKTKYSILASDLARNFTKAQYDYTMSQLK